jgi:hypothetical protein
MTDHVDMSSVLSHGNCSCPTASCQQQLAYLGSGDLHRTTWFVEHKAIGCVRARWLHIVMPDSGACVSYMLSV